MRIDGLPVTRTRVLFIILVVQKYIRLISENWISCTRTQTTTFIDDKFSSRCILQFIAFLFSAASSTFIQIPREIRDRMSRTKVIFLFWWMTYKSGSRLIPVFSVCLIPHVRIMRTICVGISCNCDGRTGVAWRPLFWRRARKHGTLFWQLIKKKRDGAAGALQLVLTLSRISPVCSNNLVNKYKEPGLCGIPRRKEIRHKLISWLIGCTPHHSMWALIFDVIVFKFMTLFVFDISENGRINTGFL